MDGSPSWPGYLANAIQALTNGLTAIGDPNTDPKAYFEVSMENERQNIVSGFPSWLGFTPPSGANKLGNRLHFGLRVIGNGQQFSLSELAFDMDSSDTADTFQFAGDFSDPADSSNDYSNAIVGLNYGPDRKKGTNDDFSVTSGPVKGSGVVAFASSQQGGQAVTVKNGAQTASVAPKASTYK